MISEKEAKERIKKDDSVLYGAILPHVDLMPDFRPQETVKRMQDEPQRNWSLLLHELESINSNEDHKRLLNAINGEDDIERFIGSKVAEEFVFSYPGLSWIMLRISSEENIVPLLISEGRYLEEIEMKPSYIQYIRDLATGLFFHHIISDDVRSLGYHYWFLSTERTIEEITDEVDPYVIALSNDMNLVKIIAIQDTISDKNMNYLALQILESSLNEGATFNTISTYLYKLLEKTLTKEDIYDRLITAIDTHNIVMVKLLLSNENSTLRGKEKYEYIMNYIMFSIRALNVSALKELTKKYSKDINKAFRLHVGYDPEAEEDESRYMNDFAAGTFSVFEMNDSKQVNDMLKVMIDFLPEDMLYMFLRKTIKNNLPGSLSILISHIKISGGHLFLAIEADNSQTFKIILNSYGSDADYKGIITELIKYNKLKLLKDLVLEHSQHIAEEHLVDAIERGYAKILDILLKNTSFVTYMDKILDVILIYSNKRAGKILLSYPEVYEKANMLLVERVEELK